MAQLNGNGYYRVRNYKTQRYVYVLDNQGELNMGSTTAEMGAIELWKDVDRAMCDPATVCFIEKHDDKYDIKAQGTGVYEIIDSYVSIRANNDGTYYAYGSKDGITKYLSDAEQANGDKGNFSDAGKGEYRKWHIIPMATDNANYLGVKPSFNAGGAYYSSYYTDFPYSAYSNGVQFFYICKVVDGYAVMKEIKGTVPANTPIFIKMSSDVATNNKLNVGGSASAISDNLLKGVFFDNPNKRHYNRTKYEAKTMRMLGVMSDGKIGFITSNVEFIPKNHAYLPVPAGSPAELKLITEEEYNNLNSKKPESITLSKTKITLVEGNTHQLKATVLPEDAFDKSVTWVSNNPAIAKIDNNGVVTAVKAGVVNVTATTRNNLTASCEVIVKQPTQPDGVVLSETVVYMTVGDTHKLTATVTPDNAYDKKVTWGSYDKAKATIDNDGVITAHSAGIVRVFAQTVNGIQAFCEVVVSDPVAVESIVLSETKIKMFIGQKYQLKATVLPEDAHNKNVKWGSNDKAKAVIDDNGVILALSEGVVRVKAWSAENDKIEAYCEVIVTKEVKPVDIKLNVTNWELSTGDKFQLKATILPEDASNKSVTWSTDNEGVASVDKEGVVRAIAEGKAKITATSSNGLKAHCYVTVKDPVVMATSISLDKNIYEAVEGDEFMLKATILPENVSVKTVSWTTSDYKTASVKDGLVNVYKEGVVTITATTKDGTNLKDECIVTILSGIEEIFADVNNFPVKIFTTNGVLVKTAHSSADFSSLVPGMYIIGGKKVIIVK